MATLSVITICVNLFKLVLRSRFPLHLENLVKYPENCRHSGFFFCSEKCDSSSVVQSTIYISLSAVRWQGTFEVNELRQSSRQLKGFDSVAAGLRSSDHNKNIGIYRRLFTGDE